MKVYTRKKSSPLAVSVSANVLPKAAKVRFVEHLQRLLPLRNPSNHPNMNHVLDYVWEELERMKRVPEGDKLSNIWSLGDQSWGELRGIVGHTDSAQQLEGKDNEEVLWNNGCLVSARGKRPIGGDDKVGVAIGLTLAEFCPYLSAIFPADEEIGCVGSSGIAIPRHSLLVQCDRRGSTDLVSVIGGMPIAHSEVSATAEFLLPHRESAEGMMTDVECFADRNLCDNAFNLSCGYYKPHSKEEIVVVSHAIQTLRDAWTLLHDLPLGMPSAEEERELWKVEEEDYWSQRGFTLGDSWLDKLREKDWDKKKPTPLMDCPSCDDCGRFLAVGEQELVHYEDSSDIGLFCRHCAAVQEKLKCCSCERDCYFRDGIPAECLGFSEQYVCADCYYTDREGGDATTPIKSIA